MYPAREDLLIEPGVSFSREFTYIDKDGVAPDLSAWTAILLIKRYSNSKTPIATLANGTGVTLGAGGSIAFALTAEETAAIEIPPFMDWGQFPNEGTMTSPRDANVAGRLASWELILTDEENSLSFTPMAGIVCFR